MNLEAFDRFTVYYCSLGAVFRDVFVNGFIFIIIIRTYNICVLKNNPFGYWLSLKESKYNFSFKGMLIKNDDGASNYFEKFSTADNMA